MYRPELATLADRERRQTLIAIESLIDFESWARMREYSGLSFEEACAGVDPRRSTACCRRRRFLDAPAGQA